MAGLCIRGCAGEEKRSIKCKTRLSSWKRKPLSYHDDPSVPACGGGGEWDSAISLLRSAVEEGEVSSFFNLTVTICYVVWSINLLCKSRTATISLNWQWPTRQHVLIGKAKEDRIGRGNNFDRIRSISSLNLLRHKIAKSIQLKWISASNNGDIENGLCRRRSSWSMANWFLWERLRRWCGKYNRRPQDVALELSWDGIRPSRSCRE